MPSAASSKNAFSPLLSSEKLAFNLNLSVSLLLPSGPHPVEPAGLVGIGINKLEEETRRGQRIQLRESRKDGRTLDGEISRAAAHL